VIGMGWMGQVHSRSYNQLRDRFYESGIVPRLVICSDTVVARAREAQVRFGFAHSTTDWHEVIAHLEVEAVSITAPNGMHLKMNRAAARAKKHIRGALTRRKKASKCAVRGRGPLWGALAAY
jgi:predicted dehydrogenase